MLKLFYVIGSKSTRLRIADVSTAEMNNPRNKQKTPKAISRVRKDHDCVLFSNILPLSDHNLQSTSPDFHTLNAYYTKEAADPGKMKCQYLKNVFSKLVSISQDKFLLLRGEILEKQSLSDQSIQQKPL